MRTLFNSSPETAGGGKRLITVTDGTHNDTWEKGGQEYLRALEAFVGEVRKPGACVSVLVCVCVLRCLTGRLYYKY